MSQYQTLKQACYDANMQLPKLGLVLFTFGNASVVDREKRVFAIKPSGVPYETLKPEDIVILDFANNVQEGERRPSSDTKTHAVLYSHWDHIGGIVRTAPTPRPGPRRSATSPSWALPTPTTSRPTCPAPRPWPTP